MRDDITFTADKLTMSGPRIDGGFVVKLEVGEYMAEKIAALLLLPQQVPLEVSVGLYGGTGVTDSPEQARRWFDKPAVEMASNDNDQTAEWPDVGKS